MIRLPALRDDAVAPHEERTPHAARNGPRLRVLVVDDQQDIADSIAMLIDHVGHKGEAVYDGDAALDCARRSHPDVMFIDVGMPGMTGYELAAHVRSDASLAGILLVALTGYGRAEDRARALTAGFDVHLTKPLTEARLRDVLSGLSQQI